MKSFENLEIAVVRAPTSREVLDRLRRERPCRANPSSPRCTFKSGKDDYLLREAPASSICQRCPAFDETCNELEAAWEEWVLAQEEAFA